MRDRALRPGMIDPTEDFRQRLAITCWIGEHIQALNDSLIRLLADCQACLKSEHQPIVDIFAVPLAQEWQIDGCCNVSLTPPTILVDVGRVVPADWIRLVVHEYAHACVGLPGHSPAFLRILTHLCLGLGLEAPPPNSPEAVLSYWPPYRPTDNALSLWMGLSEFPC